MSAREKKCPKPGCGARLVVGSPCHDHDCPQDWTVKRLIAAGYRIVSDADLKAIEDAALERAAERLEAAPWLDVTTNRWFTGADYATAIRALKGEKR